MNTTTVITLAIVGLALVAGAGCSHGQERMSYIENDSIKLGINLEIGGAITYLAAKGGENLINSADWGRQIQMSHYSGPVPFEPRGKKPRPDWAGLGWNPIQSGDCYGNKSKVLECKNDGTSIYVKCIPMQWPHNNEPGECEFECWIKLDGPAVHVRSRMVNHRIDHTQYDGRDQEQPAVYTNGPWWRLMTYKGDKPFSNGELALVPAKMPWSGWQATENWAALVNDAGQGLGIYTPGVQRYIGGFAGKPGKGGAKDGSTGYIAPLGEEILDWNVDTEYRYSLIVGSLEQIRKWVYTQPRPSAVPAWRFTNSRDHWYYRNMTDTGWPIKGCLDLRPGANDPQMMGPLGFWQAAEAPKLYIEGAWKSADAAVTVFWSRTDAEMGDATSRTITVIPDGKMRVYEVNLAASPGYRGMITRLRIDPVASGKPGDQVQIRGIGFTNPNGR